MITCTDCGSNQYPGTLFCQECGNLLLNAGQSTNVLPFSDFDIQAMPSPVDMQSLESTETAKKVMFVIPSSRRRFATTLTTQIRVGRADPDANVMPELDLTPDHGVENGVSRMHAAFQLSKQGVVLIDLGSTNGTSLNNARLPARQPFVVQSGDEVRFGDLLIHVFFD
jgi:hypothetical protein